MTRVLWKQLSNSKISSKHGSCLQILLFFCVSLPVCWFMLMRNMSWTCHHFAPPTNPNGLGASQPVAHAQDLLLTELPQGFIAWKGDRKTYLFGICAIYLELRVPIEEDLDAFICNCQRVIGIIGTSHVESLQHGQSQTPKRSQLAYRVARVYVYVMFNVSWFSWFMSRWWFQPIWNKF